MSIGVARFDSYEDLDFVPALVKELGAVLRELDYAVDEHAHPTLSSSALGAAVTDALAGGGTDDVMIVHLATHGHLADGNATVFALGSDGAVDKDTSVAHWLTMRQAEERPPTLFLLDLCSAGTSARLPWQVTLGGATRSWVIAACRGDESAYDGRFTQAMITVLRALRAGELDVDPSVEYVSLATVARAVRREVNRLAEESGSYGQQVTASLVDLSDDAAPRFFRNPAFQPGGRPRLRADLDPAVLPFLDDLDEGLDARHFLERATGLGRLTDASTALVGCFTGRDEELRQISPWLNGHGDAPLCVVTGSPGSGKSALLGVLVCAASPLLRNETEPVWKKVAQWPLPVPALAAVHARQRGLATIVASVSRQLGLPENLTAAELVSLLAKRGAVLVVDALDEADSPTDIMTELLLPLVESAVRVLVGVRNYPEYEPLFERAWVVNLDDVDPDVLEEDLYKYVSSLLRTTDYRRRGAVTGEFAGAVAAALATGESTWGPFLVAGLYTRHLVTAFAATPVTDPVAAQRLGEAVPSGLPAVLELDLHAQPGQVWLRPVLSALAHARGAGMPVSVLTRVAPVFAGGLPTPSVAEIQSALKAGKFYLRQAMDSDRSNVYRLFHQGLADTLAQRPFALAGPYLDALLARLGPAAQRDWEAAEPYLFRHVADHAAEADRLAELENDPELYLHPEAVGVLGGTLAEQFAGITSAAELALAAVRKGQPELARRAANIPGHALDWQPLWTIGSPLPRAQAPLPAPGGPHLLALSANGTVVATAHDRTVHLHGHEVVHRELHGLDADITALALSPDGMRLLVGCENAQLAKLSLVTGQVSIAQPKWQQPIAAVAISDDGHGVGVSTEGLIVRWRADESKVRTVRSQYQSKQWSMTDSTLAYCVTNGRVIALSAVSGSLEEGIRSPISDVIAVSGTREHVTVIGSQGEAARYDRQRAQWRPLTTQRAVTAVATGDGSRTVLGDGDGLVSTYFDDSHMTVETLSRHPIVAVAIGADTVAALDASGDAFRCRAGIWSRLPFTTADAPDDDDPVVTVLGTNELGWSTGAIQEVDPRSGVLGSRVDLLQEPLIEIEHHVVGGKEGFLVSSMLRSVLVTRGGDVVLRRQASKQHAVDTIVHNGLLVSAVVTSAGFGILVVEDPDGSDPDDLDPNSRLVRHGYLGSTAVACMGGEDGVVRVWDLDSARVVAELVVGQPILQIVVGDVLLVRTAGEVVAFEYVGVAR